MAEGSKTFDDAQVYRGEIRGLIPGYDALHETLPCIAGAHLPVQGRALIVGCGPGYELVDLALGSSLWMVDAIDPEPTMVQHARGLAKRAGLEHRVRVEQARLEDFEPRTPYDVVVVSLVGHLIADDGARFDFYRHFSRCMSPAGVGLMAELVHDGEHDDASVAAHVAWARERGLSETRLRALRRCLTREFARLTAPRRNTLLRAAGLEPRLVFHRCLSVAGWIVVADCPRSASISQKL